jgi:intracellular sulfur oxidation DsrE/DsrF family protein
VLVFVVGYTQRIVNRRPSMKRIIFVGLLALASLGFVQAQRQPYRVVFDLTSRDTLDQKAVLRWIREVATSSPSAEMEVVMYAKGFELVLPERSAFIADVKEAMKNPHVSFKVCAIALKNNNIDKSQLLAGVETTPDGIYELVSKQQDHWGYIKVAH